MRLSIIGPAYPLRGGIAHHVHAVRQGLLSRGHTVQVVSFRQLYLKPFFPGRTEFDTSELKLETDAQPLLVPLNPFTWLDTSRAVKRFEPDAVLIQWWNPFFGPSIGSIARFISRSGIQCIFECHNVIPHEHPRLLRPLLNFGLRAANQFIVHSESDRDILLGIRPGVEVRVAPLPRVDQFRSSHHPDRSGRRILFFGLVRRYKGLAVLLEAMSKVIKRVQCELTIAGEFYEPVERYEELISRLNIGDAVRLENRYVANEEVTSYFDEADVLVMPYLSATQSAVVGIALSNGLPVIATRTGGLAETVRDQQEGLLVPPNDPDALADALIDYFENQLGPTFSQNILNRIEKLGEVNNGPNEITEAIEMLCSKSASAVGN